MPAGGLAALALGRTTGQAARGPETPHEERGEVKGGGRRDSPRCLGRAPTRPRQAEESAVDGPNILR